MKKYKMAGIFILLVISIIMGLFWLNYPVVKSGKYYTSDEESFIEINSDGTFRFHIHILRSLAPEGNYVVKDNVLTLKSDLGDFQFYIKNKQLVFKEGNYMTDGEVEKGTKFKFKE